MEESKQWTVNKNVLAVSATSKFECCYEIIMVFRYCFLKNKHNLTPLVFLILQIRL
jgi:hypothetical protein